MATTWSELKKDIAVEAHPEGIWTLAVDYISGPALLKVEATGLWEYGAGKRCGPDGDLESLLSSEQAILVGAPVGAMIVKIGGSTAGTTDGTMYVAGSSVVIAVEAQKAGPLYLTINDSLLGFSDNSGTVKASIFVSPVPSAAAAGSAAAAPAS